MADDTIKSDKYQFLNKLNIRKITTPGADQGYAETWPAGEPGDESRPRPKELPIDQHGIQVFKPDEFSDDDVAGEGLHIDPVAAKVRESFIKSLDEDQIK